MGKIATIRIPTNARVDSLHLALIGQTTSIEKPGELLDHRGRTAVGTEDSLCNDSMGIPSLFPPPGSVRFKVHAHVFPDLLALASNMACHLHWWVLL